MRSTSHVFLAVLLSVTQSTSLHPYCYFVTCRHRHTSFPARSRDQNGGSRQPHPRASHPTHRIAFLQPLQPKTTANCRPIAVSESRSLSAHRLPISRTSRSAFLEKAKTWDHRFQLPGPVVPQRLPHLVCCSHGAGTGGVLSRGSRLACARS